MGCKAPLPGIFWPRPTRGFLGHPSTWTVRYEPHRRVARQRSRPTIEPEGRFGGLGFSCRWASTGRRAGRRQTDDPLWAVRSRGVLAGPGVEGQLVVDAYLKAAGSAGWRRCLHLEATSICRHAQREGRRSSASLLASSWSRIRASTRPRWSRARRAPGLPSKIECHRWRATSWCSILSS